MRKRLLLVAVFAAAIGSSRDVLAQSTTSDGHYVAGTFYCSGTFTVQDGHISRTVATILFEYWDGYNYSAPVVYSSVDSGDQLNYSSASTYNGIGEIVGRVGCEVDYYKDDAFWAGLFIGWFDWPPN
jgi:hypothetical protein